METIKEMEPYEFVEGEEDIHGKLDFINADLVGHSGLVAEVVPICVSTGAQGFLADALVLRGLATKQQFDHVAKKVSESFPEFRDIFWAQRERE